MFSLFDFVVEKVLVTTLPASELGTAMIHFKRIYSSCEFSSSLSYKLLQVRSGTTFILQCVLHLLNEHETGRCNAEPV